MLPERSTFASRSAFVAIMNAAIGPLSFTTGFPTSMSPSAQPPWKSGRFGSFMIKWKSRPTEVSMCALKASAGPTPLPGSSAKTLNRSSNMPTRIGLKSCSCSQPWIASPTGPSPPGGLSMLAIVRTRSTSSCSSIRASTAVAAFGSIATLSPAEDFEADELVVHVDQRERDRDARGRVVRLVQARERLPGRDAQVAAVFLVLDQGDDL